MMGYKPLVDDMCARQASESEHLLDYMVGICICNDDRILELFKKVFIFVSRDDCLRDICV